MSKHPEKPRNAVALSYDKTRAPYLSAKGKGLVADEIIRIAAEHGILIHEDPALVEMLSLLQLGQDIPESLYQAIAEVIAFAYSLRNDSLRSDSQHSDTTSKHNDVLLNGPTLAPPRP